MSLSLRSRAMKAGLAAAIVVAATAGTVAGVSAASAPNAAAAAPIDHQLCYAATAKYPKSPPPVMLKNQFSTFQPKFGPLVFHCNLLHRSDANTSTTPRWGYIASYNTLANVPFRQVRDYGHSLGLDPVPAGSFMQRRTVSSTR